MARFVFLLFLLVSLGVAAGAPINVGNFVWEDLNRNGLQDSAEPGLSGRTVELWDSTKTQLLGTTTTNSAGNYTLIAPGPGDYRIRVVLPFPGDRFTLKDAGNDTMDSDVNPSGADAGFTGVYTFPSNLLFTSTIDSGVISDPMRDRNIGDYVFRASTTGTQTGATALSGVAVELLDPALNVLQTTTSDNLGFYAFKAEPDTYRLRFTSPNGFLPTRNRDAGVDDAIDSDIDSNGLTPLFTVSAGQVIRDVDAGFVTPINIGNFLWEDLNRNGVQDTGEPGVANIAVQLWDAEKTLQFDSTATNASGNYTLKAPGAGTYRVRVLLRYPSDQLTAKDLGGNDTADSDINQAGMDFGFTDAFSLASNVISNSTRDAGVISDPMRDHTIGDYVFLSDARSTQAGATGFGNVTVELLTPGGTVQQKTTSSPSGFYSFKAPPGTYRLRFTAPDTFMPAPLPNTGPDDAVDSDIESDGLTAGFTLAAGQVLRNLDAGFVQAISVGDFVWNDVNGDGLQGSGERGVGNVIVELWDDQKTTRFSSMATALSGQYKLMAPGPGKYRIYVLLPVPSDSFSPKLVGTDWAKDSSINLTSADFGFSDVFTLNPTDTSNVTVDAGLKLFTGTRVLTPLQMLGIQPQSSTQWQLTFTAPIGSVLAIERSTDLKTWSALGSNFSTTATTTTRAVDSSSGPSTAFWRVRRVR